MTSPPASPPPAAPSHPTLSPPVPFLFAADALALVYIATIAAVAGVTGAYYVMFPELGALSYDVLRRPAGRWASAPFMLAVTPALTGIVGTAVTRSMPYGFASVLITVGGAIAIIVALRSPIAPAISAGLLPLVLGVRSWWYPPAILFGSALLALISLGWRRAAVTLIATPAPDTTSAHSPFAAPDALRWTAALLLFVTAAVGCVELTGLRFILFPPLVVIAYEMFRHPAECPWAGRLLHLPLGCFLCAAGGFLAHAAIPIAPLAAAASMAWGIAVLRVLRLHVPPALAVALLPMVMTRPTILYPLAVAIGTALAAAWFALFSKWNERRAPNTA